VFFTTVVTVSIPELGYAANSQRDACLEGRCQDGKSQADARGALLGKNENKKRPKGKKLFGIRCAKDEDCGALGFI